MIEIMKAAVYCGTYYRYNCGSLFGKWLKLADYKGKSEFLAACRKLHSREHDPEFMFQDSENIPSSMYGESYVKEEIWQVINALRNCTPDKQQAFYEYCENNGLEQDLQAFQEFDKKNISQTKKMPYEEEIKAELAKCKWAQDWDYLKKHSSTFIKIDGKIVRIEKPEIETRFCFGYSDFGQGATYEEANEACQSFGEKQFLRENLKSFDDILDYFLPENEQSDHLHWQGRNLYLYKNYDYDIYSVHFLRDYDVQNEPWRWGKITPIKVSADGVKFYHQTLISERAKFEKRLRSYLKRYGTSKLHTWTY